MGKEFEKELTRVCIHEPRCCTPGTNTTWLSSYEKKMKALVTQSCPILCEPMNRSMPGLPVHRQLPEFTQIHVYRAGDAIQPSHPLSSPSPALNLSQHQGLFK